LLHCNAYECKVGDIAAALGLAMTDLFATAATLPKRTRQPKAKAKTGNGRVYQSPEQAIAGIVKQLGKPTGCWIYQEQGPHELMRVYRFDPPGKNKECRPVYPDANGWHLGDPPGKLPLYHRDELDAADTVFVTEGEKCADLVRGLGLVATTSSHGNQSAAKSDWTPLAGKTAVSILPDHDEPGERYAAAVAAILAKLKPPPDAIRIIRLPGLGDGDDIEQWLEQQPESWGPEECRRELDRLWADAPPCLPPPSDGTPKAPPADRGEPRPEIKVTTKEWHVNDQAIAALTAEEGLFQRNFQLVTVCKDSKPDFGPGVRRASDSPIIRPVQPASLRETLTRVADWKKNKPNRDGTPQLEDAHPPRWSVEAILARDEWPTIRYLMGIVEAPTLRADGSLIDTAGYDAATGLLYTPNDHFPAVAPSPTLEEAQTSAKLLLSIVQDFPFKKGHEAAWLAALLTPMARFLIDGPCPLFLFEANTSGAGKSKLCDLIALVNTGREMTRTGYYHDPIEMDKQITATALAGDRIVLFDNLDNGGRLGNSSLDRALTARTYRGRVLGKTEMTSDLDLSCVFFVTGNNLILCGDVVRRVITSRLESPMERPEERSNFAIKSCRCGCGGDLLAHVKRHRGELVAAALTILRAFLRAGKPDPKLTPMDFDAWASLIRNAVHWSTGIDPAIGRKDRNADPDRELEAAFVEGWYEVQQGEQVGGMTSARLIEILKQPENQFRFKMIRAAIAGMWSKLKPDELPSSGSIGTKLQKLRGKPFGDKRIDVVGDEHRSKQWGVKSLAPR
jgi:hypothetical protein